jgi:hypothetical protein
MLAGAAIGGTLGYAWGNHGNDLKQYNFQRFAIQLFGQVFLTFVSLQIIYIGSGYGYGGGYGGGYGYGGGWGGGGYHDGNDTTINNYNITNVNDNDTTNINNTETNTNITEGADGSKLCIKFYLLFFYQKNLQFV